jgi:hypothetical protein
MKMRNAMAWIFAFCLLVPVINAQKDVLSRTDGWLNGRAWKEMPDSAKTMYIIGFFDGHRLPTGTDMEGYKKTQEELHSSLSFSEIRSEIDSFYRQGANGPLPIWIGMHYVAKKAKGATSKELGEYLSESRKDYSGSD